MIKCFRRKGPSPWLPPEQSKLSQEFLLQLPDTGKEILSAVEFPMHIKYLFELRWHLWPLPSQSQRQESCRASPSCKCPAAPAQSPAWRAKQSVWPLHKNQPSQPPISTQEGKLTSALLPDRWFTTFLRVFWPFDYLILSLTPNVELDANTQDLPLHQPQRTYSLSVFWPSPQDPTDTQLGKAGSQVQLKQEWLAMWPSTCDGSETPDLSS